MKKSSEMEIDFSEVQNFEHSTVSRPTDNERSINTTCNLLEMAHAIARALPSHRVIALNA